jgi:phospholipid/cholesterol/gamma-HCH transport system ATP-binding protein
VSLIQLKNVYKAFGDLKVLQNVSLDIPEGQTTAIIGPSGTGKSVCIKHMVGLLRPDQGEVLCFGTDMASASETEIYAARRRMGMLFQDGALFDSMSVGENVAFPLVHHAPELSATERAERVEAKLRLVDLPGFSSRAISELSGGQRKRVGLARAIIMEPEVVLFDEPNSGLDPLTSDAIDQLICSMKEKLGITFIVISHDIVGTINVADHIAMLFGGELIEWAPTQQFLRSENPVVRRFLNRNLVLPDGPDSVARLPSP